MTRRIHSWLRRLALCLLAMPIGQAWALGASFDGASGVLTLPEVKVGSSTYGNVLLDLVNPNTLTFRLREATLKQTAGTTTISFDAATGVLTIPEVLVGGDTYRATLALTDPTTYTFMLSSATRIAQAATLSQLQADIFTPLCSGCHTGGGSSLPSAMALTAGNAFANLVNVSSRQRSGVMRVAPGNPDGSYLIRKLEGTDIGGSRMPLGGPFLEADLIARVRSWIASGAPNN